MNMFKYSFGCLFLLLAQRWLLSYALSSPSHRRARAARSPSSAKVSTVDTATGAMMHQHLEQTSCRNDMDSRRSFLLTAAMAPMVCCVSPAKALADGTRSGSTGKNTAAKTLPAKPSPSSAQEKITNKVQFNIRISRADGSFYIRDDETDDDVFYCRLVVGLFGQDVPNHVQRFLSYCQDGITSTASNDETSETDTTPISYARSVFSGLDPSTGLLLGGVIPSLSVTSVMGGTSSALEYRGRLLPASLWLDPTIDGKAPLSHSGKGLLTHAKFDVTPSFGITTRTDCRELDATHRIFGKILFDESDGAYEFLDRIRDLPTYSLERPMGDDPDSVSDMVADAVFSAQREFFRGFAKNIGDTRLDKLYPGKFLRRVEVTQVSVLK